MNIPLLPILIASITTFVAILLLRPFALSVGLVDKPNSRKQHTGSVPLIGGITMYLGAVISIFVTSNDFNQFNYLFLATLILIIIGIIDDRLNISVSLRLAIQILVAMIIVTLGDTTIGSFGSLFGNGSIILNEWGYFISVLAIITAMNAINMLDGLHGLAGGSSLITFLAILYLSIDSASQGIILILFLCCSVLPVFLIHNLCLGVSKSKRIFMGDAGSLVIGLMIVWFLLKLSQGEARSFAPVTALWLFAVPLVEMFAVIFRRLASGKSPFKPDLSHAHHILIRSSFGEKSTLIVLLIFSFLMAVIGILGEQYGIPEWVMFVGFLLIFVVHIFLHKVFVRNIKSDIK